MLAKSDSQKVYLLAESLRNKTMVTSVLRTELAGMHRKCRQQTTHQRLVQNKVHHQLDTGCNIQDTCLISMYSSSTALLQARHRVSVGYSHIAKGRVALPGVLVDVLWQATFPTSCNWW